MSTPGLNKYYDQNRALGEAITAGIEFVVCYGGNLTHFIEDVQIGIEDAMDEAANERALDWKADELGMKY